MVPENFAMFVPGGYFHGTCNLDDWMAAFGCQGGSYHHLTFAAQMGYLPLAEALATRGWADAEVGVAGVDGNRPRTYRSVLSEVVFFMCSVLGSDQLRDFESQNGSPFPVSP